MNYEPWVTPIVNAPPVFNPYLTPQVARVPQATRGLGDVDPVGKTASKLNSTQKFMLAIHGAILLAVSYHGYKRNRNSVPWGLSWALGGIACPTIMLGFALTQGFADPAKKE